MRQVGDLVEDPMTNSTAPIIIKPNVAFSQGDTFVFGSWVCIANGAEFFQHYLKPTLESEPAPMALPQALMDDLAKIFGEISLSDPIIELESESEYNSTSTHTWTEPRELAPEPSFGFDFPFGFRNIGAAFQSALPTLQRPGTEIKFEYIPDSETTHDYCYSDSSEYKFDYGSNSS